MIPAVRSINPVDRFTVKVKWGKEVYPDVEVNTDEPPLVFKAQLFALTGVNPIRQKVMMKGGTLKDDVWGNIQIVEGQNILLMGSKDEDVPVEPAVKPMFVEDMTESQLATVVSYPYSRIELMLTMVIVRKKN